MIFVIPEIFAKNLSHKKLSISIKYLQWLLQVYYAPIGPRQSTDDSLALEVFFSLIITILALSTDI